MLPAPFLRMLYPLEKSAYAHAALVSTLTSGMQERILSKGVPRDKVVIFSHAADETLFNIRQQHDGRRFRAEFGLGGDFLAIHCGNMGVKQGLEVILAAADRTRALSSLKYLLVGEGAMCESLKRQAAHMKLDNVRILPVQPKDVFHDMLAGTDTALVTQQISVSDVVFPSKIVTLLAAGCPVLASVNPGSQAARVVRDSGAGMVLEPESPAALADAVLELQNEPDTRARMSARAQTYARHHWAGDHIMRYMERELARVAQQRSPSLNRRAISATIGDSAGR